MQILSGKIIQDKSGPRDSCRFPSWKTQDRQNIGTQQSRPRPPMRRKDPEQVVHLRDVKKRSWRQIAETLHVSVGGVRMAYKKAKPAPAPPHMDWSAVMNRPAPLTSLKMSGTVRGELTQIISGLKAEQALIADKISALEGALKYFQQ